MPRYRDMTNRELIDTAKDWVTPHPATSRLLHAVTSRLEALAEGAQAEAPVAPKTRCRTWLAVRKARGLSPEARKWLRNHPDASVRSRYEASILKGKAGDSYEQLSRDFSQTRYSSARVATGDTGAAPCGDPS